MTLGRDNETYHYSYSFQEVTEPYNNDDAYYYFENDVYLSRTRQIIAGIIPMCTGLISAIGSITLMYLILTEDNRTKRTQQHLLLLGQVQQHQQSRNNSTDENHRDREGTNSGGEPNDSDERILFMRTTTATTIHSNNNNALLPATTSTTPGTITNQETTSPYQRKSTLKQNYKNNVAVRVNRTFQRIMIGLCLSDLCTILATASSTFPLPTGTTGVWLAKGTTTTCAMQGFFVQLGLSSTLYSASLSIYFLLSILPNIRSGTIEKIEPYLHAVPIVFAISTGTAGLFLQSFNPLPLGIACWVAEFPRGCSSNIDDTTTIDTNNSNESPILCTRGHNAEKLVWVFGISVIFSSVIIIIFCMTWMYLSIRNQIHKIEFSYGVQATNNNSNATQTTNTTNATTSTAIISTSSIDVFIKTQETPGSNTTSIMKRNATSATTSAPAVAAITNSSKAAREISHHSKTMLQNVSRQAFLYVFAFFLTYTWAIILRIMEFRDISDGKFAISLLNVTFFPCQGFLNLMIYLRPRYIEIRLNNTTISRMHAIKIVLGFVLELPLTIREKESWSCGDDSTNRQRHGIVGEEHLDDTGTATRQLNSCESESNCDVSAIIRRESSVKNFCGFSIDASLGQGNLFGYSDEDGVAATTVRRGSGDSLNMGQRRRSRRSSDVSTRKVKNKFATRTTTKGRSSSYSSDFLDVTTTPTIVPPTKPLTETNSTNATVTSADNDLVCVASKPKSPMNEAVDDSRKSTSIIGFASVPCSNIGSNISRCHSTELQQKGSKSLLVHRNNDLDDDDDNLDLESNDNVSTSTSESNNRNNSRKHNLNREKDIANNLVPLEFETLQLGHDNVERRQQHQPPQQSSNEAVVMEHSNLFTSCWASEDAGDDAHSETIITELDGTNDEVEGSSKCAYIRVEP